MYVLYVLNIKLKYLYYVCMHIPYVYYLLLHIVLISYMYVCIYLYQSNSNCTCSVIFTIKYSYIRLIMKHKLTIF